MKFDLVIVKVRWKRESTEHLKFKKPWPSSLQKKKNIPINLSIS